MPLVTDRDQGILALELSAEGDFGAVKDGFEDAVTKALTEVAEALLVDAYAFVPVLTGALRDNGRVEVLDLGEPVPLIRVVYDLVYAIRQHEEEFRHPSLGFYGAAKYLQRPFELNQKFYLALFEHVFTRELRSRLG